MLPEVYVKDFLGAEWLLTIPQPTYANGADHHMWVYCETEDPTFDNYTVIPIPIFIDWWF